MNAPEIRMHAEPDRSAVTATDASDGIRVLALNRPAVYNSLHPAGASALRAAIADAAGDRSVRALVLTGSGPNFCTGADLKHRKTPGEEPVLWALQDCLKALRDGPLPCIAAVNGFAYGAGFSLALACDYIVADSTARFSAPFTGIGLIPDVGMASTLPARVGPGLARRWMYEGTVVDAATALASGLADERAEADGALAVALARARLWTVRAPLAIAGLRRMMACADGELQSLLDEERRVQAGLAATADFAEGVASFRERRPPRFQGA